MNTQPPSLGRSVLYRPIQQGAVDKKVRPALIIDIRPGGEEAGDPVQLQVFTPNGDRYVDAKWSEQGDEGTWFWPPKVGLRPEKIDEPTESKADVPDKAATEGCST